MIMDLLNNIWIALTTENEGFVNWMSIPILFFIETPLTMFLFLYALNIQANKTQKITYVFIMSLVGIISNFIIPSPFNIIINYGIAYILIYILFKLNLLHTLIAVIIPMGVFALLNVLLLNPYLSLANITYEQIMTIPIYRYSYLLIFYAIILIIITILKYKQLPLNILEEFDIKNKTILFLNFTIGLIAVLLQLFLTVYYIDSLPIIITIISSLSLFAYFFISIYSLTRITKLVLTTQKLKSAKAYNKSLSDLYNDVRGFKHDFDNIISAIGGYIKTNDINGLKKYYSELEEDCKIVNSEATLNPEIINDPAIYNLLSNKYNKAENKNIKVNLDFFMDLTTLNMKIYECTRILGILLDNAIEEAEKCENKILNIKFRNEHNRHRQVIIIENTYSNKNIDINKIFEKGVSGKPEHTGLGLWEVRQILNKNNNLNLHTIPDSEFFIQQLEIYY